MTRTSCCWRAASERTAARERSSSAGPVHAPTSRRSAAGCSRSSRSTRHAGLRVPRCSSTCSTARRMRASSARAWPRAMLRTPRPSERSSQSPPAAVEREREIDALRRLVDDVDELSVAVGEEDALRAERDRLRHLDRLVEAAAAAADRINPEEGAGALSLSGDAAHALESAAELDPALAAPARRSPGGGDAPARGGCRAPPLPAGARGAARPPRSGGVSAGAARRDGPPARRALRRRARDAGRGGPGAARVTRTRRPGGGPPARGARGRRTPSCAPPPRRCTTCGSPLQARSRARSRRTSPTSAWSTRRSRSASPSASRVRAAPTTSSCCCRRTPGLPQRRSHAPRRAASSRASRWPCGSQRATAPRAPRSSSTRSTPAWAGAPRARSARSCSASPSTPSCSASRTFRRSRRSRSATSASSRLAGEPSETRIDELTGDAVIEELVRMLGADVGDPDARALAASLRSGLVAERP